MRYKMIWESLPELSWEYEFHSGSDALAMDYAGRHLVRLNKPPRIVVFAFPDYGDPYPVGAVSLTKLSFKTEALCEPTKQNAPQT